ncbi:MAG: glucoamylase family protein, partial [Ferruginibacter sp.]
MKIYSLLLLAFPVLFSSCSKSKTADPIPTPAANFSITNWDVNGVNSLSDYKAVRINALIRLNFPVAIDRATVSTAIGFNGGNYTTSYLNGDSVILLQPAAALSYLTKYTVTISTLLRSKPGGYLNQAVNFSLLTELDSADKFAQIPDAQLLDKVQRQTFTYFWNFGHPISGMARERNSSGETVTTGGTGFGVMAMVVAVSRGFITRAEGRDRVLKITNFLINNCTRYHGAFAHWVNGSTGVTQPFSANDNGADLVETSLLLQGLITARQYFNGADAVEADLRNKINSIWDAVQWNWFRQNNQNVLYWHWSPDKAWTINQQIKGWNEALIVYVLASSSRTDSIPKIVYQNGWASNGSIINNNNYYGYQLPMGPANGGPLFFEHYSFLGINPNGLTDVYANYQTQTLNHTKINFEYCKANPQNWYGYSSQAWGLTASDGPSPDFYQAYSPSNDRGVITPTAAISSMPYTPTESMAALKFFYYKLGDKLWGEYGFYDSYKLSEPWFASSTLAIDQGPIIVM